MLVIAYTEIPIVVGRYSCILSQIYNVTPGNLNYMCPKSPINKTLIYSKSMQLGSLQIYRSNANMVFKKYGVVSTYRVCVCGWMYTW